MGFHPNFSRWSNYLIIFFFGKKLNYFLVLLKIYFVLSNFVFLYTLQTGPFVKLPLGKLSHRSPYVCIRLVQLQLLPSPRDHIRPFASFTPFTTQDPISQNEWNKHRGQQQWQPPPALHLPRLGHRYLCCPLRHRSLACLPHSQALPAKLHSPRHDCLQLQRLHRTTLRSHHQDAGELYL